MTGAASFTINAHDYRTRSTLAEFKQRIESRQARIGIVGMGYVGLPLALLFSEERFRVTGFDIDARQGQHAQRRRLLHRPHSRREIIQQAQTVRLPRHLRLRRDRRHGRRHHLRPHSARRVSRARPQLRHRHRRSPSPPTSTRASSSFSRAPPIPAPPRRSSSPSSSPAIRSGLKVVARTPDEPGFYVAFSPEREDPGNDTVARHDIPKVIGGCGPAAVELASALYGTIFNRTVPVSSPAVAEMTKLLENIYRCVNIALVNELKQLCMRMGIDILEVIDAAKTKPFGFQAFYPGPGLGGHCIPIDPFYLSWKAKQFDFRTRFIELAGEVNIGMPYFVIEQTAAALNEHSQVASRDRRSWSSASPTSATSTICASRPRSPSSSCSAKSGAIVAYNDPYFPTVGRGRHYDLNMTSTPLDDLGQYDAVLIVTDHTSYDYRRIVDRIADRRRHAQRHQGHRLHQNRPLLRAPQAVPRLAPAPRKFHACGPGSLRLRRFVAPNHADGSKSNQYRVI